MVDMGRFDTSNAFGQIVVGLIDMVKPMEDLHKDTERKMAFNAGRLMARDSGMNYTEICQHVSEIEEKTRIRLLHNGLVGDEIECAVSSMMLPETLNGAKCEFRMSSPKMIRQDSDSS